MLPCPSTGDRPERLRILGELASGIVHDLNNVLSPIVVGVQLLRQTPAPEVSARILDTIEASALRGASALRQLLVFARGETATVECAKVAALVEETAALLRHAFPKNITLVTAVPADLPPAYFDAAQLQQILINLCVNARDAMPAGGQLTIRASVRRAAGDAGDEDEIVLEVQDTGVGIPPEVQDKVFEPFFSTKPVGQGTGLGLATVRRQVLAHDGTIELTSAPGEGTTVRLGLRIGRTAPTEKPEPSPLPDGDGHLVLVVDDEESVRDMLERVLRRQGFRTIMAENGAAGISEHHRAGADIRLTLTDLDMPVMDGARMLGDLKLPVHAALVVTGQDELDSGRFMLPRDYRVVRKPFTIEELFAGVRACLESRASDVSAKRQPSS